MCRKSLVPLCRKVTYGHLGQHDLLRTRADAEKYLLLACLNLVEECVVYTGAQLQSK